MDRFGGDHQIENQVRLANKIVGLLNTEFDEENFQDEVILGNGKLLHAIFSKTDAPFKDIHRHLKEITPITRLSHSELFTGGNSGLSLISELKKEIRSADRVDLLVSFIKFRGIVSLEHELKDFTSKGGQLRVITTTYMGATDREAIRLLSQLSNTEIKISFNAGNERLHAKAYLFERNTGFHTAYVGSSNFSRTALTDGLEWNLKITTQEVSHIIEKFRKTFESYWNSDEFELFEKENASQWDRLCLALDKGKSGNVPTLSSVFFEIQPYPFQKEILEKLAVERDVHQRYRNLLVAATGTGKTVISAFDFKQFREKNPQARLLFLAHREEILRQGLDIYRKILRNNNFGDLWLGGAEPENYKHVFASVLTLNNRITDIKLSPAYYDFIVIDECHHMTASSYRKIINYFQPKILLGLTATPERLDGGDITEDFHNRIAAEIRLPEALNRKLLCPFVYFGVSDSVDLDGIGWDKGRYVPSELSKVYTSNDFRVGEIIKALENYTRDLHAVRALGFCVSIEHAKFMAEKFNFSGLKSAFLTSENTEARITLREQLLAKEVNYLFVVDIFNEGVDIPEIDTVLFLRPTESLTIFLQQLGRGLRLAEDKEGLTVLDFVGNARPEYNFEKKFRAIVGQTSTKLEKEIEEDFPRLPLGCAIVLERKARDIILRNIRASTRYNESQLIQKIRDFKQDTNLPLSLENFTEWYSIPLQFIYSGEGSGWKRLCQKAGAISNFDSYAESEITKAISQKWLSARSMSYFQFILVCAKVNFNISTNDCTEVERQMLLMLHYDIWQSGGSHKSLEDSIRAIGKNETLVAEMVEVLTMLVNSIDFIELDGNLPFSQPLKIHARYTRDQILAAFGFSTFEKKSTNREGVAYNKELNIELLFITMNKSEKYYSPTTMYKDFAINDRLFHWQSQNSAGRDTEKGKSYINHKKLKKRILLFVREKKLDEFGKTCGYVFVGEADIKAYEGDKPMSITWMLKEPLPYNLWSEAAKLQVG
jgi:superfamily II DNA or RNA helicase